MGELLVHSRSLYSIFQLHPEYNGDGGDGQGQEATERDAIDATRANA
jgi:hypothetical protein